MKITIKKIALLITLLPLLSLVINLSAAQAPFFQALFEQKQAAAEKKFAEKANVNQGRVDQAKAAAEQKFAEWNQKMAENEQKQAAAQAKLPELEKALEAMLAESDDDWLATFQDKLLFSIPLSNHPPVAIGFFGRDLVVFSFYALNVLLDHTLYSNLHRYYVNHAIEAIMFNKDQILNCINQLSIGENGLIDRNDAYTKLEELLGERCFPSPTFSLHELKRFITGQLGYLLGSEAIAGLQHKILPPGHGGFFGPLKQQLENTEKQRQRKDADGCYYLPFSNIVLPILDIYLLRAGVIANTWNENAPWIRNLLLRWVDCYHPMLNSYWFYLGKRTLILSRFFLQAHNAYRQALTDMLLKNIEQIKTILQMPEPQDSNTPAKITTSSFSPYETTKRDPTQAEQLLKLLLINQQQETFTSWLQFKKSCINWTDFEIEMLLLLPVWYKAGKWLLS